MTSVFVVERYERSLTEQFADVPDALSGCYCTRLFKPLIINGSALCRVSTDVLKKFELCLHRSGRHIQRIL